MDKTSTGNNGTDNANKDKTGSRQALRKLLENAKVHFMQLGLKRKTVIFVMSTFIGAVLFTSFIFGVIYSNTWKRTVINHVKSIESEKKTESEAILKIWITWLIISATATGCRIFSRKVFPLCEGRRWRKMPEIFWGASVPCMKEISLR